MLFFIILSFLIGFILRIIPLFSQGFWLDEAASFHLAYNFSPWLSFFKPPDIDNPPFYEILLHFWIKMFGISYYTVRLPSLIFSLGTMFMVWKIAQIFHKKLSSYILFIMAISSFQIHYAWQARMYSLLIFLSSLSLYLFIKFVSKIFNNEKINKKEILIFSLINFLGLITNYSFFIFLISLGILVLFIFKKRILKVLAKYKQSFYLIIFLHFLFSLFIFTFYFLPRRHMFFNNSLWIKPPNFSSVILLVNTLANSGTDMFLNNPQLNFLSLSSFLVTGIFFLFFLTFNFPKKLKLLKQVIFTLFFIPIIIAIAFSLLTQRSVFIPRFLVFSNTVFNLGLGTWFFLLWQSRKSSKNKLIKRISYFIFLILFVLNIRNNWFLNFNSYSFYILPDYKRAIQSLKNSITSNDRVIVFPDYAQPLFNYYWQSFDKNKIVDDNFTKTIYIYKFKDEILAEDYWRSRSKQIIVDVVDFCQQKKFDQLYLGEMIEILQCKVD